MKKFLFGVLFIVMLSGMAAAQNQSDEYNKVEIFAGYSGAFTLSADDSVADVDHGFNVAAVYNFHKYFGVKVDASGTFGKVSGNYFSPFGSPPIPVREFRADHSLYNLTAGIQFKNNKRDAVAKPFGHVLVGVGKHTDKFTTSCPTGAVCPPFDQDITGLSVIFGGGLDVKVNRRIDIRAIQFDINTISGESGVQKAYYHNFRFSSGIVFKF